MLEGLAVPDSNIVAPGIFGYNIASRSRLTIPHRKKLLAEAGSPNGFALTIHGPNKRYISDEQVVQTDAQFLSRIGIQTRGETLPLAVYFPKAGKSEFSMGLLGWGSLAGDFAFRTVLGTPNPETGWGSWNWGKCSNPALDQLVQSALASVDAAQREDFARQAALALKDYAALPLHHQSAS
ncbi:MAG: hypothetical protein HYZ65_07895 [Burkholderiales bacterium]|nr:hypothetical protein [Burkholderiales bacterium]